MKDGTPILFPQQELDVSGHMKLRGGGPSCWPNFGAMPDQKNNAYYKGIKLPQHGFLRLSEGSLWPASPACENAMHFDFPESDGFPWTHTAGVKTTISKDHLQLQHVLTGYRSCKCTGPEFMPISMGFHPYFSTFGEDFVVIAGRQRFESKNIVEGESFTVKRPTNGKLLLKLIHGEMLISLEGGQYSHLVIWTDMIGKYICVEPILGRPHVHLLEPCDRCVGVCEMTFTPS